MGPWLATGAHPLKRKETLMISPWAWLRRRAAVRRLHAVRAAYITNPRFSEAEYKQVRAAEAEAYGLGWRPELSGDCWVPFPYREVDKQAWTRPNVRKH